ncbi:hypothetical protein GM182_04755 [bacterium 3DAC]|jgi:type IV pilus assembly protein PilC|nr:type II secretion system F family protein [Dictyoglomota bacterium]UZN23196.1 hypothetical protein GM182_04755 [bacterium 3DAC]
MPYYKYVAKKGAFGTVKGVIEAPSRRVALEKLMDMGITQVLSLKETVQTSSSGKVFRKKVSLKALTLATRQLATMIESGMQLVESLDIVAQQIQDPYLRQVFTEIANMVRRGDTTFGDALAMYSGVFPPMYPNIIKAAQVTGHLEKALNDVATLLEKNMTIRRKIKGAMTYPIVVLSISLAIFLGIVIFIIPKFEQMFKDFGIKKMPALTTFMIGLARFIIKYWPWMVGVIVLIFVLNYFGMLGFKLGGKYWHRLKLKMPLFGRLTRTSILAQFASNFATMVRSGISPTEALDNLKDVMGNKVYEEAIADIISKVKGGSRISAAMSQYPDLFPPMFINMVRIGEASGSLDKMLEKMASYYEEEVDAAVEALASAMEPITVLVLALMVGTAIVSIYLPIFSMISQMNL